jgi:hypothetical protein
VRYLYNPPLSPFRYTCMLLRINTSLFKYCVITTKKKNQCYYLSIQYICIYIFQKGTLSEFSVTLCSCHGVWCCCERRSSSLNTWLEIAPCWLATSWAASCRCSSLHIRDIYTHIYIYIYMQHLYFAIQTNACIYIFIYLC